MAVICSNMISNDNNFYYHTVFFSCCGIAVACPVLYEGYSINWSPNRTTYSYKDIIHFQCDAGYKLSGPSSLVCQAEGHDTIGHWSKKQPACVGRHLLEVKVSIYTLLINQFKYSTTICQKSMLSFSDYITRCCQKIE